MINTTTLWNTKNASLAKKPIYIFQIGGLDEAYSTHDLIREGITGAIPAFEAWLRTPTGATQAIDVQGGTSSIGEMQLEVIDYGGAIRQLVGTNTLEGRTATLTVGYPGTDISDFATLNEYTLYKIVPSPFYTSFLFNARDIQIDTKATIWNHPINGFPINENNPWIIQGTPCEIIQAVTLLALRMDADTVDTDTMQAMDAVSEGLYASCRPFRFEMTEPFTAKDFLEEQIYKVAGMYPIVTNTGQLSVRSFRPPAAGPTAVLDLNQTNVTVLPAYDRMEILNDLLWSMDSDGQSNYGTTLFARGTRPKTSVPPLYLNYLPPWPVTQIEGFCFFCQNRQAAQVACYSCVWTSRK